MTEPRPLVPVNDALEQLRQGDQQWEAAVRAFDPYPVRLRTLAKAAEQRSRALMFAHLANITGDPRPGAGNMDKLAFELTKAGGRPGPQETWRRFDQIVKDMGAALEAGIYPELARVSSELATVTNELADACERATPTGRSQSA